MNSRLSTIIIALFWAFSIVFTLGVYFGNHIVYSLTSLKLFPDFARQFPDLFGKYGENAWSLPNHSYMIWLLVIPVLLYGAVLLYQVFIKKYNRLHLNISPLVLWVSVVVGMLCTFLLFSYQPANNVFSSHTETLAQTRDRLLEEGTYPAELNDDADKAIGFLRDHQAWEWNDVDILGATGGFLLKILGATLALFIILMLSYILGAMILSRERFWNIHRKIPEELSSKNSTFVLFSTALGIIIATGALFTLAFFNAAVAILLWPLVLVPFFNIKRCKDYLQFWWRPIITGTPHFYSIGIIFAVLLWTFVVLNGYQLFRPIPIGWDDASLYVNLPNLMSQTHGLIAGHSSYAWGVFMSFGTLLFGSIPVTLYLSWLGGALALIALYMILRTFAGAKASLAAVTVFYSLPLVFFQSSQDMKVDMALFFFSIMSVYALILYWKKKQEALPLKQISLVCLMGLFAGFAFSIKYTAFLSLIGIAVLLLWHLAGFGGLFVITGGVLLAQGLTNGLSYAGLYFPEHLLFMCRDLGVLLMLAGIIITAWTHKEQWKTILISMVVLGLTAAMPILPWLVKNGMETQSLNPVSLLVGKHQNPQLTPAVIRTGPTPVEGEYSVAETTPEVSSTEVELRRYMGFDGGLFDYISLPYDSTMNTHVQGTYVDISFLFFLLLPLIVVILPKKNASLYNAFFILCWLCTSIVIHTGAVTQNYGAIPECPFVESSWECYDILKTRAQQADFEGVSSEYVAQYYTTSKLYFETPLHLVGQSLMAKKPLDDLGTSFTDNTFSNNTTALLAPGITVGFILIAAFLVVLLWRWLLIDDFAKKAVMVSLLIWVLWALLASGVIWYGIVGFLPLLAGIAYLLHESEMSEDGFWKGMGISILVVCLLSIGANLTLKMDSLDRADLAKYKGGITSAEDTVKNLLPSYQGIADIINDAEHGVMKFSKVYRVGTFMPFFIERNHERVLADNQLQQFVQFYTGMDNRDQYTFTKRLLASDIEFIVFDMNLSTIDSSAEQSLAKDHQMFLDFVSNNPYLEIIGSNLREMPNTPEQLSRLRPGSTLVITTSSGTIYRVVTPENIATLPEDTLALSRGDIIAWKINKDLLPE